MRTKSPRFTTARFHRDSGPLSLFNRVKFKLNAPTELKLHADHLHDRAFERNAPLDELKKFDPATWSLVIVEVRTDTGKFVSTVWEVKTSVSTWWVVIGLHDTVKSVYPVRNKTGFGSDIVRSGLLFDFVEKVNRELMNNANNA